MKCLMSCLFGSVAILAAPMAHALVLNGSFESYGGTGFSTNTGEGITNWTITAGGVDIVDDSFWLPADGETSLSLGWFNPATISQTVTTTNGQAYDLSFFMAAEIFGGSALRTMDVLWNGNIVATPSFAFTGQGPSNMGWTQHNVIVVGTGSDLLQFRSTTTDQANYGPALDDVRMAPVPEPMTVAALGLGLAGFLRRRRAK